MLHMLLFLLFTMPLVYRVLLALFDPQRLHEQESLQVIQMIEKNMGSLKRDPLLTQIGNELLVNQEQEAEFYLVPSSLVNAVALPNGSILIWQGLLDRIRRDEHKVAAVLAHEISLICIMTIIFVVYIGWFYYNLCWVFCLEVY